MEFNQSAARSLVEGIEETLKLHRLGLVEQLGRSFTTHELNRKLKFLVKKIHWQSKKYG